MAERYELQRLLWDLRHDDLLAERAQLDLRSVLRRYHLADDESSALLRRDFPSLLAMGVSPLLLFFGALRMGVSRPEYYESLRAPVASNPRGGAG